MSGGSHLGDSPPANASEKGADATAGSWVGFADEQDDWSGAAANGVGASVSPGGASGLGPPDAVLRLKAEVQDTQLQLSEAHRVQSALRGEAERSQRQVEILERRDAERDLESTALRQELQAARGRADKLAELLNEEREKVNAVYEELQATARQNEELRAAEAKAIAAEYATEMRLTLARSAEERLERELREARAALAEDRARHQRAWAAAAAERRAEDEAARIRQRREELAGRGEVAAQHENRARARRAQQRRGAGQRARVARLEQPRGQRHAEHLGGGRRAAPRSVPPRADRARGGMRWGMRGGRCGGRNRPRGGQRSPAAAHARVERAPRPHDQPRHQRPPPRPRRPGRQPLCAPPFLPTRVLVRGAGAGAGAGASVRFVGAGNDCLLETAAPPARSSRLTNIGRSPGSIRRCTSRMLPARRPRPAVSRPRAPLQPPGWVGARGVLAAGVTRADARFRS